MHHVSEKTRLLQEISILEFKVLMQRLENLQHQVKEDKSKDSWHNDHNNDNDLDSILLLSPSPISPLLSNVKSDFESNDLINLIDAREIHYRALLDTIWALCDEVEQACILNHIAKPPMCTSQLHLLTHFANFWPCLFCKKLQVNLDILDLLLNCISNHPIFHSRSYNSQLPVAIQLAIFLNHVGHYGNAIATEDMAQWAGVSIGSVVNCIE